VTRPDWSGTCPDWPAHPHTSMVAASGKVRSNLAIITHQAIQNTMKLVPRFRTEKRPPAAQRFVYTTEYPRSTSRKIGIKRPLP
jgi:hypothetical protein